MAAAQSFAQQLNSTSQSIQSLRSNADQDIGTSVGQVNTALTLIANINSQLQGLPATDPTAATLQDQRDSAIDQLSQLVDIRVTTDNNNQASVYTTSGVQLVGVQASQLQYTSKGDLSATSLWNADPTKTRSATLDDPSQFQPMLDIWTSSAQPWVCLSQAIPRYPQAPQLA